MSVIDILLIFLLLGPPVVRAERTAFAAFDDPLSGLDVTYIFHLAVWLIAGLYSVACILLDKNYRAWLIGNLKRIPLLFLILFLLHATISSFYSILPYYTLYYSAKGWVLLFVFSRAIYSSLQKRVIPANHILKLAFIAYLIGFFLLIGFSVINPSLVYRNSLLGRRLTGGFLGDYGSFGLIVLSFSLASLINLKFSFLRNLLYITLIFTAMVYIVLAQTRTTSIIMFIIIIFYILMPPNNSIKFIWVGFSGGIILIISYLLKEEIVSLFFRGQDWGQLMTLSDRTVVYSFLLEYWKKSPIIGLGFQAGSRFASIDFMTLTGMNIGAAHDAISKVLVDMGVVGLILVSLSLLTVWIFMIKMIKESTISPVKRLFLLAIGIFITLSNFTSGGIVDPGNYTCSLFILLVVLTSFEHSIPSQLLPSPRRRRAGF